MKNISTHRRCSDRAWARLRARAEARDVVRVRIDRSGRRYWLLDSEWGQPGVGTYWLVAVRRRAGDDWVLYFDGEETARAADLDALVRLARFGDS